MRPHVHSLCTHSAGTTLNNDAAITVHQAADLLRGRDGVVPEDTVVPDSDIGDVPAGSVQPPSKSPPPPIIAARAASASAAAAATAAVAHPAPAAAPVASKELATTRVARRSIAWLQWVSTTMRQVASWQHIWLSGLVCALWVIAMLYTSLAISLAHCAAVWLLFKRYGALKLQVVARLSVRVCVALCSNLTRLCFAGGAEGPAAGRAVPVGEAEYTHARGGLPQRAGASSEQQ